MIKTAEIFWTLCLLCTLALCAACGDEGADGITDSAGGDGDGAIDGDGPEDSDSNAHDWSDYPEDNSDGDADDQSGTGETEYIGNQHEDIPYNAETGIRACQEWTYDDKQRVLSHKMDEDCDDAPDFCMDYTYEDHSDGGYTMTEIMDKGCDQILDRCRIEEYDLQGRLTSTGFDGDCSGENEGHCKTYTYDDLNSTGTVFEDSNCDGTPNLCQYVTYHEGFSASSVEHDEDCDGSIDYYHIYTFSSEGVMQKLESKRDYDKDDKNDDCKTTFYTATGELSKTYVDLNCDGIKDKDCYDWAYDSQDRLISSTEDNNCDGTVDNNCITQTWTDIEHGTKMHKENDENCSGKVLNCRNYEYDENSLKIREDYDTGCDSQIDSCTYIYYDENDLPILWEEDEQCDGEPDRCVHQSYSATEELASYHIDNLCDGSKDSLCQDWSFDDLGNVTEEIINNDCYGTLDYRNYYEYDENGNMTKSHRDCINKYENVCM